MVQNIVLSTLPKLYWKKILALKKSNFKGTMSQDILGPKTTPIMIKSLTITNTVPLLVKNKL